MKFDTEAFKAALGRLGVEVNNIKVDKDTVRCTLRTSLKMIPVNFNISPSPLAYAAIPYSPAPGFTVNVNTSTQAQVLKWDDYVEIIFSPSLDPDEWVEKKSTADLDADVLTYLKGLVKHVFPGPDPNNRINVSHSPSDVADFVRDEWNHALTVQPPLIRLGFNKRAILSTMFPHIDVQRRIGELQQQAVRNMMGPGVVAQPVEDDKTPSAPYGVVSPSSCPNHFSSVPAPPDHVAQALDSMAPCYACSRVQTSRRNQDGVPLCAKCSGWPDWDVTLGPSR